MANMVNGLFTGNIEPTSTICGCISIYKNLWPNPAETIDLVNYQCNGFEGDVFYERAATAGEGQQQDHRTNRVLSISQRANLGNNSALQSIHNQFYMMLLATTIPYARKFSIAEELWHEGYSMLRYNVGEEYKLHYDTTTKMGRAISAICYLNDDYEGGELEFPYFGVTIKPEKGMLILFPSNFAYAHVARPITAGSKYALVTWIRDRPIQN
jgi:predicted 2-oxoglutarate/Fe(II)-dependent dioxygenase YbiX